MGGGRLVGCRRGDAADGVAADALAAAAGAVATAVGTWQADLAVDFLAISSSQTKSLPLLIKEREHSMAPLGVYRDGSDECL